MTPEHTAAAALTLALELPATMIDLASADTAIGSSLHESLERHVTELMTALGIPGPCRAEVSVRSDDVPPGDKLLRVTVDGRHARYPDEMLVRAFSYVTERIPDPEISPATIRQWIEHGSHASADAHAQAMVVEFLSLACMETLKYQPSLLFGPAQAAAYAGSMTQAAGANRAASAVDVNGTWLMNVLGQVLDLRISIADQAAVADVLARGFAIDRSPQDIAEDVIDRLRSDAIEVRAQRTYLEQLTSRWEEDAPAMFPFMRDGLFEELGLVFPSLRFVEDDRLKASCLAFKVNDLVFLPLRGLEAGELLVNDTVQRLRLSDLQGVATLNPATGQPASVIGSTVEVPPDLTTWNQMQFVVLGLAEFLRQHGWCVVHVQGVRQLLESLGRALPALKALVVSRVSDQDLARVMRALVRDRASARNLPLILERWLDYDMLRRQNATPPIAAREATRRNALEFVRAGLAREIASKVTRHTNTAVVYLVDTNIARLTAMHSVSELGETGDAILQAIRAELAHLPRTAQVPHLLVFTESRATLQRLVASEFPRMTVFAHEELPPGTNVMPVARIAFSAPAASAAG